MSTTPKPNKPHFAGMLTEHLNRIGENRVALAKSLKVTPGTISDWCNQDKSTAPTPEQLDGICRFIGLDPDSPPYRELHDCFPQSAVEQEPVGRPPTPEPAPEAESEPPKTGTLAAFWVSASAKVRTLRGRKLVASATVGALILVGVVLLILKPWDHGTTGVVTQPTREAPPASVTAPVLTATVAPAAVGAPPMNATPSSRPGEGAVTGTAPPSCAVDVRSLYVPAGAMGDIGDVTIEDAYTAIVHPPSSTSVRFSYQPGGQGWGGVYFLRADIQHPQGDWGDEAGYDLSAATALTFWARGELGGERVEFKAGGIDSPGKPYQDTFETSLGTVTLTQDWQQFRIELAGLNLSDVIGPFAWVATRANNPDGLTFYVSDIAYEGVCTPKRLTGAAP